jgi:hypothetical protein
MATIMSADLRAQPWWTPADQAELDLHLHELVERRSEHRLRCSVCTAGYPPCPFVCTEIERVIEWRDNRVLRSRATWLRRVAEQRAELGHLPETIEGCIAVLGVAARIIRVIGGGDDV